MKSVVVLRDARVDEVRGQGFGDLREGGFEELDATVDAMVWFPELRMKSQYAQEATQAFA